MRYYSFPGVLIGAILMLAGPAVSTAAAQTTVGGHFGVLLPLVTHANNETTDISDDFTIGFPTGITVRKSPAFAFDLELVPVVQNEPLDVRLEVHPGVLWGFSPGWNAGIRVAFGVNQARWGFTPLVNLELLDLGGGGSLFAEMVVPIRFLEDAVGDGFTSVGLGVHLGVAF